MSYRAMSAELDVDSRMASSIEDLDGDDDDDSNNEQLTTPPSRPTHPQSSSSLLSPPQSQPRNTTILSKNTANMPTTASGSAIANVNGKRPLNTISNGIEDDYDSQSIAQVDAQSQTQKQQQSGLMGTLKGKQRQQEQPSQHHQQQQQQQQQLPVQTHAASGYTWTQPEDEPGFAWLTKRALDEHNRAIDGMAHREFMVRGRYGDLFEMVEREQAMINSLKQR